MVVLGSGFLDRKLLSICLRIILLCRSQEKALRNGCEGLLL
jgi:hypothetical protein